VGFLMKKLVLFLLIVFLAACNAKPKEEPVDPQENKNTSEETNEPTEDEETGENILEDAPNTPTNFDEIIAYPVGPLSGNSYYAQLDGRNTLTKEQLVEEILKVMPMFDEEDLKDPTYLDKWFNALYSLIAENYRDPQDILDEYSYEAFGQMMINGKPVQFQDQLNVLIILDASGSMENKINGQSMMQIALDEINGLVDRLPEEVNIGLRVYGGKSTEAKLSCSDIELLEPIASSNKDKVKAALNGITAKGSTPIAASLQQAANDFANFPSTSNSNFIYLISDGMETCGGNPITEAEKLVSSNASPIINVIGFNVDGKGQTQLESIANSGNGQYSHALNKQAFAESLKSIDKLIAAWEKRKLELIDDALDYRGKISSALYDLQKEWKDNIDDEYRAFMYIMDELNSRSDLIDPKVYGQAQRILLDKSDKKNDLYRKALDDKYKQLINDLDELYESIKASLQ
jgi:Ca-activated chloride channel homolog